jgi:hypothetical protein
VAVSHRGSRGGLTTKTHLVADGKGRALAFVLTGGQVADTTMLPGTLDEICVAGATGRPRQRPDRLLADRAARPGRTGRGCASAASPRLAVRSDKTARNHHSGQCLAATLHWVQTFSNTG